MIRPREGNKREELVKAARYLFMIEGIANVSVSKIVKKAGVAQGTFYLYFDSKDEILDVIAEDIANEITNGIVKIADDQNLNAFEKLIKIFTSCFDFSSFPKEVIEYFHNPEHQEAHNRLAEAMIKKIIPFLEKILEQGVKEGTFNIKYPKEAAQILTSIANYPQDLIYLKDRGAYKRWEETAIDFIVRGLGVKEEFIKQLKLPTERG